MGQIIAVALLLIAMVPPSLALTSITDKGTDVLDSGEFNLVNYITYFDDGKKAFLDGNYTAANEAFNHALNQNPQNYEAQLWKGYALVKLGDYDGSKFDETIGNFTEAAKSDNDTIKLSALYALAQLYYEKGNSDRANKDANHKLAQEKLKALLDINPTNIQGLMLLGDLYYQDNDNANAILTYEKVRKVEPGNLVALKNVGLANFGAEKWDDANKVLREATEAGYVNDSVIWTDLGGSLLALGQDMKGTEKTDILNQAVKALTNASDINPNNANTYYWKGEALAGLGKNSEALEAFETAISIAGNNAHVTEAYGDALYQLKMYKEAAQAYDDAVDSINNDVQRVNQTITVPPGSPEERELYAQNLTDSGRNGTVAKLTYMEGASNYLSGDNEAAIRSLEISTAVNGSNSDAWVILADAQKKTGDFTGSAASENEITKIGKAWKGDVDTALQNIENTLGAKVTKLEGLISADSIKKLISENTVAEDKSITEDKVKDLIGKSSVSDDGKVIPPK